MKFIKKFESLNVKRYWLVSTEPIKYKKSLIYLDVPINSGLYHCKLYNEAYKVFITEDELCGFGWVGIDQLDWLKDNDFKYMYEVDDIMLDTKKYNL